MALFAFIDADLARIAEIAPAGYFLALRIRGSSPLMAFKNCPQAWVDRQCVAMIDEIAGAARSIRPDVLVMCHGGPISMPEDAAYVLARTQGCHGFYGASSAERLPAETAIAAQIRAFKSIPALKGSADD